MTYIQQHWRLLCTSLALLLVLTVNHRSLPAYVHAATQTQHAMVKKSDRKADTCVVKQKVSFEATTSFADLNFTEPVTLLTLSFTRPIFQIVRSFIATAYWTSFLQQLSILPLSPNAP